MPVLNRDWYNSLIDDDGTGTIGSVLDKAAVDALMDVIDAALVPGGFVIWQLGGFPSSSAVWLRGDAQWAAIGEADVTNLVTDLAATEKTANKNAANGYAGLNASSKLTGSQQVYGTAANTAAEGNDTRLSNARTPTAHASTHIDGGSDNFRLDQLSPPIDVTTLNASTSAHGLLPKLAGGSTLFLRADGTWQAPPGSAGTVAGPGTTVVGNLPTWNDTTGTSLADSGMPISAVKLTPQSTTATGNQADFNLTQKFTYLRCTGAAPVFGGFQVNGAAPSDGDRVRIVCLGTTAKVAHQETGFESVAAHRVICPSTTGQIVGVNGVMDLIYDGTTGRWRETVLEPGAPIDVAFSAGNFTGNGSMTWTVGSGDQDTFAYVQRGKVVTLFTSINSSTVGGTLNNRLNIALPNGFVVAKSTRNQVHLFDNNVGVSGIGVLTAGASVIGFGRFDNGNFAASTDGTYVLGQTVFEVN